jgi:AbiJ N-terminal domain 3
MKSQIRHLVADALYPTKAYNLPSVCERYGLEPGTGDEAFSSKTRYIVKRLEKLSDDKVFSIAKQVIADFPDDKLQTAIEQLEKDGHLVSDITRQHLAAALNAWPLAGKRDLLETLRSYWPIEQITSRYHPFASLADDIDRHVLRNDDWSNAEILEQAGFLKCSQAGLTGFLDQRHREVIASVRPDPAATGTG